MPSGKRIKINSASIEEIAELYDIGPVLAQRIVNYRSAIGYFRGPTDLTKVKGISAQLALTIAHQIDWDILTDNSQEQFKVNWLQVVITGGVALSGAWHLVNNAPTTVNDVLQIAVTGTIFSSSGDGPPIWWLLLHYLSATIGAICLTGANIAWCLRALIRNQNRARAFGRGGVQLVSVTIFMYIFGVVYVAISYLLCSHGGWCDVLDDMGNLTFLIHVIWVTLSFGSIVLALFRPKLAFRPEVARIFDIGIILAGPAIAGGMWYTRNSIPLWLLVVDGLVCFNNARVALISIRTRQSLYAVNLDYYLGSEFIQQTITEINDFLQWVNIHLPDPEEQKRLLRVLRTAYPGVRPRGLLIFLFVGGVGGILSVILTATIEYFVTMQLDRLFLPFP